MAKRSKEEKVMHEYKEGTLHSGSKHGPVVTSRKQAIAIALSEAGKSDVPKHSHKKGHHSPTMEFYDMHQIHSHDTPTSEEC